MKREFSTRTCNQPSLSHNELHWTPQPRVIDLNDVNVVVIETEHTVSQGEPIKSHVCSFLTTYMV